MSERRLEIRSVVRTRNLARKLGELLQPGDFVGLQGELGAGKTEFVRALCAGAGVERSQVSSPSFAIVAAYGGGRLPLHHADLYRLADADELYATGFFDLLGGPSAVVVEWIDRVPEAAPPVHLWLTLTVTGARTRSLQVVARGEQAERRLEQWLGRPKAQKR